MYSMKDWQGLRWIKWFYTGVIESKSEELSMRLLTDLIWKSKITLGLYFQLNWFLGNYATFDLMFMHVEHWTASINKDYARMKVKDGSVVGTHILMILSSLHWKKQRNVIIDNRRSISIAPSGVYDHIALLLSAS